MERRAEGVDEAARRGPPGGPGTSPAPRRAAVWSQPAEPGES